jgi:hypothetical protein
MPSAMRALHKLSISLVLSLVPAASWAQGTASSSAAFDHKAMLDQFNEQADILQARVAELKDRIFLLRESVVLGSFAETKAIILHTDEVGSSFTLEEIVYTFDGKELLNVKGAQAAERQREFEVFNGPLPAGPHEISVSMIYGGSGFGIFTYLKGYRFKIDSKYRFNAAEGRLTKVTVIPEARKDITIDPKDRLFVRYETDVLTHGSEKR